MSKKIDIEIPFGDGVTPNANGRIYTQEAVDTALSKMKTKKVFLTNPMTSFDPDAGVDLTQVRGVIVEAEKEGMTIKAKVEVSDDIMADFIEKHLDVVPNGVGDIENGVVKNYDLYSVSLTMDSAFKPVREPQNLDEYLGDKNGADIRPREPTDEG